MKITYDPEVDAMYIQLVEGNFECRTLRLNEEIAFDIGPEEQLIGIEILDATESLGLKPPATIEIKNVLAKAG